MGVGVEKVMSKPFLATQIIIDYDVALSLGKGFEQIVLWLTSVTALEPTVVIVSLDDGLGVTPMELGECHAKGERVVETPNQEQSLAIGKWQVLI